MPLKNKSMALIRIRRTPYSSLESFMKDLFYKNEELSSKAMKLLTLIYSDGLKSSDWKLIIRELFNVSEPTKSDELIISEALSKKGVYKEEVKSRIKLRLLHNELLNSGDEEVINAVKRINEWNSAVTAYYSIINKLRAVGLIEKQEGVYKKSTKFNNRLNQILSMLEGFNNELRKSDD